jgi:hypothetical protein
MAQTEREERRWQWRRRATSCPRRGVDFLRLDSAADPAAAESRRRKSTPRRGQEVARRRHCHRLSSRSVCARGCPRVLILPAAGLMRSEVPSPGVEAGGGEQPPALVEALTFFVSIRRRRDHRDAQGRRTVVVIETKKVNASTRAGGCSPPPLPPPFFALGLRPRLSTRFGGGGIIAMLKVGVPSSSHFRTTARCRSSATRSTRIPRATIVVRRLGHFVLLLLRPGNGSATSLRRVTTL